MASSANLLYTTDSVRAFYLQNGEETDLTPSGSQTLSLLMVPTKTVEEEEDFYLHLRLPPELDLPLPATTQIFPQGSNNYLIPHAKGAFIRIQFPTLSSTDVDTFESILAQCTAFHEARPQPPPRDEAHAYHHHGKESNGKVVLVDEDDGSVVGELTDHVVEKPGVTPGSKSEYISIYHKSEEEKKLMMMIYAEPVAIQLPTEGNQQISVVGDVSDDFLQVARDPRYRKSRMVQSSAEVSRLIVTGSTRLSNLLTSGADSFTQKTEPNPKPVSFSDTTQARIRTASHFSHDAARFSARTTAQVAGAAQNLGASFARHGNHHNSREDGKKPGVLNKSLIAFTTLADGVERGAKNVLESGSSAASQMVSHRYGNEAGSVARDFTSGFKNVGLVYIDATGVSRKAFLKSVAKGMVVGRTRDGKRVMVGSGDGGEIPSEEPLRKRTPPPPYEDAKGTSSLAMGKDVK